MARIGHPTGKESSDLARSSQMRREPDGVVWIPSGVYQSYGHMAGRGQMGPWPASACQARAAHPDCDGSVVVCVPCHGMVVDSTMVVRSASISPM